MKCIQAKTLLDNIDRSISEINKLKICSDLEKSYLAKFLVVYICGIYEEAIESILNERINALGSEKLSKFFEKYIDNNFRNPNYQKVSDLLGMFDSSWRETIKELPDQSKTALGNILTNKNALAHGTLCTITLDEVIDYYQDSVLLIRKIDEIVELT